MRDYCRSWFMLSIGSRTARAMKPTIPHQKDQCRLKECGEGLDQGLDFFLHAVGDLFQQFIDAGGFLADGNDMADVFREVFQLPSPRERDTLVVDIDDHLVQSTDERRLTTTCLAISREVFRSTPLFSRVPRVWQ